MNSFEYIEVSVRLEPFSEETAEMLMADLAELPYDSFVTEEPVLKAYIPLSEYRPGDLKVVLSGYPDVAGFEAVPIQGQNWNKEWESRFEPIVVDGKVTIKASFNENVPRTRFNIWGDDFDHIKYGLSRAKYRNIPVPDFSRQLDTVQNSLLASIHNVFEVGVDQVIAENREQHYIQDRMSETGYSPAADTLAAPAAVQDSVALMTRRFEAASVETDKEALKEEVLEVISGEAAGEVEKSPAKKEEDE